MPFAGGLDQFAALFGILAQRNEILHACVVRACRTRGRRTHRLRRGAAGDRRGAVGGKRARLSERGGGSRTIDGWKRRGIAGRRCAVDGRKWRGGLTGERRRKRALG